MILSKKFATFATIDSQKYPIDAGHVQDARRVDACITAVPRRGGARTFTVCPDMVLAKRHDFPVSKP